MVDSNPETNKFAAERAANFIKNDFDIYKYVPEEKFDKLGGEQKIINTDIFPLKDPVEK